MSAAYHLFPSTIPPMNPARAPVHNPRPNAPGSPKPSGNIPRGNPSLPAQETQNQNLILPIVPSLLGIFSWQFLSSRDLHTQNIDNLGYQWPTQSISSFRGWLSVLASPWPDEFTAQQESPYQNQQVVPSPLDSSKALVISYTKMSHRALLLI